MMTTGQQITGYNYQDYVPTEGILCPICEITCNTLQNLNRHLDIEHNEEDSKGALLSWLRNAQKKVQTSLTTKSGLSPPTSSSSTSNLKQWMEPSLMSSFQNLSLSNTSPTFFVSDTDRQDDFVTRDHWQRETGNDKCNIPGCNKIVGKSSAGKQHCRNCGKLYCDLHTQYEIKLNRQAHHDPEHGYLDYEGATRSKTAFFLKQREKTIDKVYLKSNRLEKRLEKLARIHQSTDSKKPSTNSGDLHRLNSGLLSPSSASLNSFTLERSDSTSSRDSLGSMLSPKSSFVSNSNSILSMKLKYRDGEQTVTKWEDDRAVKTCPYCENSFTLINHTFDDEPVGDTRACRDCQRSVFRRKLKNEEASKPLPIIQLYNQLAITRKNIEKQLPKFHETILMLEKENVKAHSHESFIKAAKIRKSLLDNFTLYDTLAKSIKTLPVRSACMKRLQANICNAANIYLQQNMLPLQMLPRILKSENNNGKKDGNKLKGNTPEGIELQAQLSTYLEQYSLVEGFIKEANADRKYDDVKTLKYSLDELHSEILRLRKLLGE
ncbi:hypothetical protein INT46_004969 [Mucor plumbeus]|uniref:C2H2-type domain-containing protein n=1 Tax=Mucor plumbeus TaxID=97098 RepID=A0A8H7RN81_9FUNG|nr:hypothetical protein INT46_004969 [Mucor plumbeus]